MADPLPTHDQGPSLDLEPEHRRAICNEIGQQLRDTLADDNPSAPSRLQDLVERLTELDGATPSTIDLEDDPASLPLWKRVMRFWWFP